MTATARRARWLALAPAAIAMLASLVAQLWGIGRDLPYPPDVDEPIFLRAAAHVASGHLDPLWFGNPGSTVIYPLALVLRLLVAIAHPGTLLHVSTTAVEARVAADPGTVYLAGRLLSAAYGVGVAGLTAALAGRVTGRLGATVAGLVVATTPIVVAYGQLLRTDTAGTFFALGAVVLLLRAIERDRRRDWVAAAVAVGLAVASRYFFVVLAVPYLVAVVAAARRRAPDVPARSRELAGGIVRRAVWFGLAPLVFLAATPALPFEIRTAIRDLLFESRGTSPGADGLSALGNLAWYLGTALPAAVPLPVLAVAVAGIGLLARRRAVVAAVVLAYAAAYLLGTSLSPLHWDRYVIPLVTVIGLAVAVAVDALLRLEVPAAARTAIAVFVAGVLLAGPALQVVAADRVASVPSTRATATDWARDHLAGALVCEELYTLYQDPALRLYRVFSLADETMAAYRARGCTYLATSTSMSDRFRDPARYPTQSAFYARLPVDARVVATFAAAPGQGGPTIRVLALP